MNETQYERALSHGLPESCRQRRESRSTAFYRAWMASATRHKGYRTLVWNRPSSEYRRLSPVHSEENTP